MNRKSFFKRLAIGSAAIIFTPDQIFDPKTNRTWNYNQEKKEYVLSEKDKKQITEALIDAVIVAAGAAFVNYVFDQIFPPKTYSK